VCLLVDGALLALAVWLMITPRLTRGWGLALAGGCIVAGAVIACLVPMIFRALPRRQRRACIHVQLTRL
jgi:hypothetical protein